MPRPSRRLDALLLASGRTLYPASGCAGLSVRAVAAHAGVNAGMFHYHFGTKADFLRAVLASLYEPVAAGVAAEAAQGGAAVERLRAALRVLAHALREHRATIARVWLDAVAGEATARDFMQANAPRHLGVLLALLAEADDSGALRPAAPGQRLALLLGAVGLPLVFVSALVDADVAPPPVGAAFAAQVMSDAAIDERIDMALRGLAA